MIDINELFKLPVDDAQKVLDEKLPGHRILAMIDSNPDATKCWIISGSIINVRLQED